MLQSLEMRSFVLLQEKKLGEKDSTKVCKRKAKMYQFNHYCKGLGNNKKTYTHCFSTRKNKRPTKNIHIYIYIYIYPNIYIRAFDVIHLIIFLVYWSTIFWRELIVIFYPIRETYSIIPQSK